MAAADIYGIHAVSAALQRGAVAALWVQDGRDDARIAALVAAAQDAGVPVQRVPRRRLDEIAGNGAHQGVAAAGRPPAATVESLEAVLDRAAGPPLLLVLDGVQDPHNLGACLRTALAAGAHAVVAPRDRAAGITATVRKVAAGAAERMPFIQVTNLARTLEDLQRRGIWTVGADGGAPAPLYTVDLTVPLALVMGGEEKGLRQLTRRHCDFLAAIPLAGGVESLNVSVAAGIALFEAVRQRASAASAG